MATYRAPLKDMNFVLHEVFQVEKLWASLRGVQEAVDRDTSDAILNEAAKLMEAVIAPLNRESDEEGSRWAEGEVSAPDGSELYLLGATLQGFTSISPLYSGCGLMFTASSYCDTVGMTFTSDRNMIPDPEVMRACLNEAVTGLESYLTSRKTRRKASSALKKPGAKAKDSHTGIPL